MMNLNKYYRTSVYNYLEITQELDEIIIGSMLGDLFAEKPSTRHNTRLQFRQSEINKDYIYHLYGLFEKYCGSPPKHMSSFDSRPNKMETYYSVKFQTLSLKCFNKYKELYYNEEGLKIVPRNLDSLLTAKGLSYWFMDDGYKAPKGFYISTESYSFEENLFLVDILTNKFKLSSSAHKITNGYRLYIRNTSIVKFKELVSPHIIPHFQYKLNI